MKSLKLIGIIIFSISIIGCASKRPITIEEKTKIGVFSSLSNKTHNNIWTKENARDGKQEDIVIPVDWLLSKYVEDKLISAIAYKLGVSAIKVEDINAPLSESDSISFGFSSVDGKYLKPFSELRDELNIEVLILAMPAWRYYHGESPLYWKGVGVQSFEDGTYGHVGIDIFAIDLKTMKIIFPAVQDGITMKPFIRDYKISPNDVSISRLDKTIDFNASYKKRVYSEAEAIINWFVTELPITVK